MTQAIMTTEASVPTNVEASPERGPELQEHAAGSKPGARKQAALLRDEDDNHEDTSGSRKEASEDEREEGETDEEERAPPLPIGEEPPPLPDEAPPDDGWEAIWDDAQQAYYFHNRETGVTTWENPRVPDPTLTSTQREETQTVPVAGGYNPAIHGDYDPNADYALEARAQEQAAAAAVDAQAQGYNLTAPEYGATGAFNRFTGRWQAADQNPDRHSDEAKSKRQMNAFFDVDAAANSHGGKSLKAERQSKKLSKSELKAFKEKRKEKKEEKRRAWLRD